MFSGCRPAHQHQPPGQGVMVRAGVVSFFESLHPGYVSGPARGQVEYPAFCDDSSDQQSHSLLQRTELTARVICACAGLSSEAVSFVGCLANIAAVAHWVGNKCTELMAGNGHEEHSEAGKKRHSDTTCRRPAQLPKAAIALGAVSCLGAVGAREQPWIEVNGVDVLSKIGRDAAYPLDGSYRQMVDIDARNLTRPIGSLRSPFAGRYDGGCKVIQNLKHCFVEKLDGNGRLYNQIFSNASIVSDKPAGVVACQLSGKAALGNILVYGSSVVTTKRKAPAGLATAVAGSKTVIDGFKVVGPATVETTRSESPAGLVVGEAHGIVNDTWSMNGKVKTCRSQSEAGAVAGTTDGFINKTMNIRTRVSTHEDLAHAGGGAGHALAGAVIDNTVLVSCELFTNGSESSVGGGAGVVENGATATNTRLINTTLKTHGDNAHAAAGAGHLKGTVTGTTMVNGEISTRGFRAEAAVGGGHVFASGRVGKITCLNVTIKTSGVGSGAGVGAGVAAGSVRQTVCYSSKILTTNNGASAGVGAGLAGDTVAGVVSISCNVTTLGDYSEAGLGAGLGPAYRLAAVYSNVRTTGRERVRSARGGDIFTCSTSDGENRFVPCCEEYFNSSCRRIPNELCSYADRRVLTAQCKLLSPHFADSGKGDALICLAIPAPTASASVLSGWSVLGITLGLLGFVGLIGVGCALRRHYQNRDTGQQKAASDGD